MRVVQKYGGSSVATIEQIKKIAESIKNRLKTTPEIVVVVSAMGKTTNALIALAQTVTTSPNKRELDALISTGENQSVALMAMALQDLNIPAISLTGFQAEIHTNNTYGRAFITKINTSRIEQELAQHKVVIVTGFQGICENKDLTTLGRGGSEATSKNKTKEISLKYTSNNNTEKTLLKKTLLYNPLTHNKTLPNSSPTFNKNKLKDTSNDTFIYDITTLGRGGSDTTAVALATQLKCPCEIYTDVDSVFTINPALYPNARSLHKVGYNSMMEMALNGAKVLETRCVELAKKYAVPLYLGHTLNNDFNKGSFIMQEEDLEEMPITNLSIKEDISLINLSFKNGELISKIFEVIQKHSINLEMFYSGQNKKQYVLSFVCPNNEVNDIIQDLQIVSSEIKISTFTEYVKLSLIGSGLSTHTDIAHELFSTLAKNQIQVHQIVITEISISFTIYKKDKEKAVTTIATLFQL